MSFAIRTELIGIPDNALSEFRLAFHGAGVRRAVEAIELGLGGEVEWEFYRGDAAVIGNLETAVAVYGKRLGRRKRRRRSSELNEKREESSAGAQGTLTVGAQMKGERE